MKKFCTILNTAIFLTAGALRGRRAPVEGVADSSDEAQGEASPTQNKKMPV